MSRMMALGDSRTAFGGWQDLLVASLNSAAPRVPSWSFRTNANPTYDAAVSVMGVNMAAHLNYNTSSLAYPLVVLMDFGEHDMLGATPNQATFEANYLAMVDAIVARWFNVAIYIDFPWAVPVDANYAAVKGYLQNVIAARSMCHVGVDHGAVLKGNDAGATNTYDGIHMNAAGWAAYAAALKTAMGY